MSTRIEQECKGYGSGDIGTWPKLPGMHSPRTVYIGLRGAAYRWCSERRLLPSTAEDSSPEALHMQLVRRSLLVVPAAVGILSIACGQGSATLSPTGPSTPIASSILSDDTG